MCVCVCVRRVCESGRGKRCQGRQLASRRRAVGSEVVVQTYRFGGLGCCESRQTFLGWTACLKAESSGGRDGFSVCRLGRVVWHHK
jgi:hypothetical protein